MVDRAWVAAAVLCMVGLVWAWSLSFFVHQIMFSPTEEHFDAVSDGLRD